MSAQRKARERVQQAQSDSLDEEMEFITAFRRLADRDRRSIINLIKATLTRQMRQEKDKQ